MTISEIKGLQENDPMSAQMNPDKAAQAPAALKRCQTVALSAFGIPDTSCEP